jgi:hypothetical protein
VLATITILRCYGMACGCVDGSRVEGDGDDGLSPPVPVRLPSRSCVVQTHVQGCGLFRLRQQKREGLRPEQLATDYRLQTTALYEQ